MCRLSFSFFFFNDTATTEIYTLSLHDALPIFAHPGACAQGLALPPLGSGTYVRRSEEHTSELQSHHDLVCRLLLEKKKKIIINHTINKIKNKNINDHICQIRMITVRHSVQTIR